MATEARARFEHAPMRKLRASDLDARIHEVAEAVAELGDGEDHAAAQAVAECRPRWIEPAELVRRLEKFIVHN